MTDIPLDLRGLKCPLPVLKARKKLATLPVGAVVAVACTDPMAAIDIPHMCREDGHRLEASGRDGEVLSFLIRRGPDPAEAR
ncbi:MAG: sulfurtransferase TusA family protein [Hyphomicrobiaceae bacterium]|nr:sulfurtransferase TusA family protein [Hyphomicrobiaceae bacterium]